MGICLVSVIPPVLFQRGINNAMIIFSEIGVLSGYSLIYIRIDPCTGSIPFKVHGNNLIAVVVTPPQ